MTFAIEILQVKVESKGKYRVAVVDHKTSDGKVDSKKVMSFADKDLPSSAEVFKTLSQAQQGDQFEIEAKKNAAGYWTWVAATPSGKSGVTSTTGKSVGAAVRSSYETPDERAARQVYIVRQSSLANAINFAGGTGKGNSVEDVIEVAKEFEAYVFSKDVVPAEVE